jgi:hypothetical protein
MLGLLLSAACTEPTINPDPATLQVIVTTLGVDVDPDGYQVTITRHPAVDVPVNDTLTLEVEEGNYTVSLGGLAPNCAIGGVDERQVTARDGASAQASFQVSCGATTGVVRVVTNSVGDEIDQDGYQITISSPGPGNTMILPANGVHDIPGLIGGAYQVTIADISSSCVVAGGTIRPVTVVTGQLTRDTTFATFLVTCLGGVVDVRAPTTGVDRDSVYTISVDGGEIGQLRSTDSLSISLVVGDHAFYLSDLAPNCSVQGPNPVTVSIVHGARTSLNFAVHCLRNVATARISAAMTGGTIDSSVRVGVDLVCDYWSYDCDFVYESLLPQNGSVLVNLSPGPHHFQLLDLSENCVVYGGSAQTIDLPVSDTVDVVFNVTCSPAGTVRVTAPTTGALPDDGYALFLDNGGGVGFAATESLTFEAVPAGQHFLTLGDVSPACQVAGQNPRVITVSADATTDVVFQVSCDPDASLVIAAPTSGGDLDDSYLAFIDNNAIGIPIPANGSVTVPVYGGVHTVTLNDLAFNCAVIGSHPVSVNVPAGGQVSVTIPVNCTRYTGTARFTITTTGPNQPSFLNLDYNCDWYYGCSRLAVPANGVASVDLSPGSWLFSFASIPPNCSVSPATSVQVSIAVGVTTDAAFTLVCQ